MSHSADRFCQLCLLPIPYGTRHQRVKNADGVLITICHNHNPRDALNRFTFSDSNDTESLSRRLQAGDVSFSIDCYHFTPMKMPSRI